jgi:hypothetical protein
MRVCCLECREKVTTPDRSVSSGGSWKHSRATGMIP